MYVDTKGIIIYSNDKVTISSGYTQNELLGKPINIFNSNYHPKEFFSSLWKTVLSGKIWNGEIRNKRKDGSFYWIFGTIIPIKNLDNEIEYFINIRQDITEVKNNRLNRIRDVIDAQEKEKENFAKELHDGLGQMLLAAKMNLVSIENELKNTGGFAYEIYQNALKILNESIQETRNISHGLMSRALLQL
ncbi:MAG TPA: PAS domain S-box protein, partial [Vicingus sp.]|nr:PAS domain S-box protein [Vicingus sp.]